MPKQSVVRPETGDVHFLAYIPAFLGSVYAFLGFPFANPAEIFFVYLFSGIYVIPPFVFAALGISFTRSILPEWHIRRPVRGGLLAFGLSILTTVVVMQIVRVVLYLIA